MTAGESFNERIPLGNVSFIIRECGSSGTDSEYEGIES